MNTNKSYLAVMIEWETDNLTVTEGSSNTFCASVVNPDVSLRDTVQLSVTTLNSTAQGCATLIFFWFCIILFKKKTTSFNCRK